MAVVPNMNVAINIDKPAETWAKKNARFLSDLISNESEIKVEYLENLLETAGELKCVRLKILLARCYELISASRVNNVTVRSDQDFESEILKEIQ